MNFKVTIFTSATMPKLLHFQYHIYLKLTIEISCNFICKLIWMWGVLENILQFVIMDIFFFFLLGCTCSNDCVASLSNKLELEKNFKLLKVVTGKIIKMSQYPLFYQIKSCNFFQCFALNDFLTSWKYILTK